MQLLFRRLQKANRLRRVQCVTLQKAACTAPKNIPASLYTFPIWQRKCGLLPTMESVKECRRTGAISSPTNLRTASTKKMSRMHLSTQSTAAATYFQKIFPRTKRILMNFQTDLSCWRMKNGCDYKIGEKERWRNRVSDDAPFFRGNSVSCGKILYFFDKQKSGREINCCR